MNTIKSIIGILALLCIQQQAFSQKGSNKCKIKNSPKEIVWDFSTGKLTEAPSCITKGSNLPIRIKNINRTLFDVVIESDFINFHQESFEILDFLKMKEDVKKAEVSANNVSQALALADVDTTKTAVADSLSSILASSKKIIECGVCLSKILQQDISYEEAKLEKNKCTKGLDKIELQAQLNTFCQCASTADDFIKSHLNNDPFIQQLNSSREQVRSNIDLQKAADNIMAIHAKISNPETFEFTTSLPIKDAYELALTLKGTPKDGVKLDSKEIPLQYPIKGIKVSISPGLFVNHFPGSRTHYLEDIRTTPDSVMIRGTFDDKSLLPSVGALVHVYFGGCKDCNIALSAGASTRLETGAMRWHLGTSLLLGKERRFVLSVGATLGQGIRELDQNYSLEQPYLKADLQDKTPTVEVPHLGWFLGFSYNLPVTPKS